MKPITSIKVAMRKRDPIIMRLGDLFTTDSELKVVNSDTTHHYTALMLLTTAITRDLARKSYSRIYFTMIGTDKMSYTIVKTTEDSIILINPKGKESKIHKKYLIEAMRRFELGETSIVLEGVRLYVCTAISRLADLAKTDIRKMETRAMDLSKWPCSSLVTWARYHLNIPSPNIPKAKHMDDKIGIINGMLKLSATRNANIPNPTKDVLIGTDTDQIYRLFMGGVANGSRFGAAIGVAFINLRSNETDSCGIENFPTIYAERDVQTSNLSMYTVVCVNNAPVWILVSPHDGHDTSITWSLRETNEVITYARRFTKANVYWLVDKLRVPSQKKKVPMSTMESLSREARTVTLGRLDAPQAEARFYATITADRGRVEPAEPMRINTDVGELERSTFNWGTGTVQAAESLSNSNRWEDGEDEMSDDLIDAQSDPEPSDNENS